MIENSKSPSNCCNFCGWEFHHDLIQKIIDKKEPVFCEFCGIELDISNVSIKKGLSKGIPTEISNIDNNGEKKKKSIVKKISKKIRPKKYSVRVISEDKDFPKIFKENLIIVISRLTYFFIREWELENNVSVSRVSLEKKIFNHFLERINPILEKRVNSKFLKNLFKIKREDFEYWLKLLQKKIALQQNYRTHFKLFLAWLIKIVFKLVSEMWDMKNLPKLHATILKDLKRFNFNSVFIQKKDKNIPPIQKIKTKLKNDKIIIKAFPRKTRNVLCENIYRKLEKAQTNSEIITSLIKDIKCKRLISEEEISIEEIKELNYRLLKFKNHLKFEEAFANYLLDLINLVEDLKKLEEEGQQINFSELTRKLIEENRNLNLSKRGLEECISGIYDHFKKVFINDFFLQRKKKKAIKGTESEKESIRCLRKEYRLLHELYNGIFAGKCSDINCNVDFKRLPAFCFHHPNPNIKISIWSHIMHKKYLEIKNELEVQKVVAICNNCHMMENASIFNDFKELITKDDLFKYSKKEIGILIDKAITIYSIRNKNSYKAGQIKYEIKRWIRKRSIIEQVFNGKCISCGESRLPTLSFHHTNPKIKKYKWGDISRKRKWNIKKLIIDFIIEEECICLCSNCHSMVETINYEKHFNKIIEMKYIKEVEKIYEDIHKSIKFYSDKIKKIKRGLAEIEIIEHI